MSIPGFIRLKNYGGVRYPLPLTCTTGSGFDASLDPDWAGERTIPPDWPPSMVPWIAECDVDPKTVVLWDFNPYNTSTQRTHLTFVKDNLSAAHGKRFFGVFVNEKNADRHAVSEMWLMNANEKAALSTSLRTVEDISDDNFGVPLIVRQPDFAGIPVLFGTVSMAWTGDMNHSYSAFSSYVASATAMEAAALEMHENYSIWSWTSYSSALLPNRLVGRAHLNLHTHYTPRFVGVDVANKTVEFFIFDDTWGYIKMLSSVLPDMGPAVSIGLVANGAVSAAAAIGLLINQNEGAPLNTIHPVIYEPVPPPGYSWLGDAGPCTQ
jgi:hypothetical protein